MKTECYKVFDMEKDIVLGFADTEMEAVQLARRKHKEDKRSYGVCFMKIVCVVPETVAL